MHAPSGRDFRARIRAVLACLCALLAALWQTSYGVTVLVKAGLLAAAADGDLAAAGLPRWNAGAAVTVVIAAEGYPGAPVTGDPVGGLEEAQQAPGAYLLYAGTVLRGGTVLSSGGRVMK